MLKSKFLHTCSKYCHDEKLINELYKELSSHYMDKNRYYHNLEHIHAIFQALENIDLSHALEFAIFYHDVIYDVKSAKNEELSALFCQKALTKLSVPKDIITKTTNIILDTKTHTPTTDDSIYMIDADLSIFSTDSRTYQKLSKQIRKEYAMYDDATYTKGRIKVLKSFLDKEKIFISKEFNKHENKARQNIQNEILLLEAEEI